MTIRRRWSAICDAPACKATELLEGDQYDGKWELGVILTDRGWDTAPGKDETLCPIYATPNETGEGQ